MHHIGLLTQIRLIDRSIFLSRLCGLLCRTFHSRERVITNSPTAKSMLNPRFTCTIYELYSTLELVISNHLNLGGNTAKRMLQNANSLNFRKKKRKCYLPKGSPGVMSSVMMAVCHKKENPYRFVSILMFTINTIHKKVSRMKRMRCKLLTISIVT